VTATPTIVVTGSSSGIGAATKRRLEATGHRVVGVDIREAEVIADLSTPAGRLAAIDGVGQLAGEAIDGLVTCAGVAGLTDRAGRLVASVNYFGTVALLDGLRPLLARGSRPAAVAMSSNSTTIQPAVPVELARRCLADDEEGARALADEASALMAYPATKLAVAWWIRRHAPTAEWAGAGITLNAVAPGKVETPLLEETRGDHVIGKLVDALPMPVGRSGTPEEIAALVAFLLGPDARFFCGSVLFCDGGTDAQLRADDFPAPMP
jgi:NAD(P)-dependent dehydrogenase (short-subunit alcohol dehydrogenase family)